MGACASSEAASCNEASTEQGLKHRSLETDTLQHFQKYTLEETNKTLKIKIKSKRKTREETRTSYPCVGRTKGIALILNNASEESKKGALVDVKNITQLFRAIKINPKIKNNLRADEILKCVEAFAKNCKAKDIDLCVIVIIGSVKSTADNNLAEIGGTDNKFLPSADIIEYFSDEKCPQLKGKPKVFLFHGHSYGQSNVQNDYTMKLSFKDIFIANAVLSGSLQKQTIASYYIQALCKVFMNEVYEKDLESMIRNVEEAVYNHDRSTQHTHFDNLYFKKCYFYAN